MTLSTSGLTVCVLNCIRKPPDQAFVAGKSMPDSCPGTQHGMESIQALMELGSMCMPCIDMLLQLVEQGAHARPFALEVSPIGYSMSSWMSACSACIA